MTEGGGVRKLAEILRESVTSVRRVFANPRLRRLNVAFAVSVVGDWAFAVAVSLYAYQKGGATVLGVVGVVRYLAMASLGPLASSLGDRYPRTKVMVSADLVRFVLVGAAAVSAALGGPALVVYGLSILSAVVGQGFRPAQAALLPSLARDPTELTAANATSSTIESVGFFAGPALAALLLAVAGTPTVFAVNALSFLWSAACIVGLRSETPTPAPRHEEGPAFVAEVSQGFRTVAGDRDLRLLVALLFLQTLVAGGSLVFNVSIALAMLHLGQSGVGLLTALIGVGGIAGGFLALVLGHRERLSFDFGIGVLLWSAPLVALALRPTVATAAVMMVLCGVGNSLVDVNAFTVLQRLVPDPVMSRVFGAVESLAIAGMAVGALLMPLMIATIGLRAGLAVLGGVVAVLALSGMKGLRRIDATSLAPAGLTLVVGNEILAPLAEALQEELARALVEVRVGAGRVVVEEGAEGDRFYLIGSGTAEVTVHGEPGGRLGPGDAFGEIALLRAVPRQATVRAVEDLMLYALERQVFLAAVTGHSEASLLANTVVSRFLAT